MYMACKQVVLLRFLQLYYCTTHNDHPAAAKQQGGLSFIMWD